MSWRTSFSSLFFALGLPLVQAQRYTAENIGVESSDVGREPARSLTPDTANQFSTYRIGCGDTLQIMVWKEPDASVPSAIVRPDGKIAIPLLKEVAVVNLTPPEAEQVIAAGLRKYIQDADVTVVVASISSRKAYIVGAVRKEGPIPLPYPMSVLQAISEAGGLTDYAKRKKIYVLRTSNGSAQRIPFNYEAVIRGEQVDRNVLLQPNDTIVVPY
jgi:polysaccharide export outer membrane protein